MGRKTPATTPNVNTGEMVLSAIKKLMKNTGWTARTIIKFIKMEYRVLDPKLSRKVSRYFESRRFSIFKGLKKLNVSLTFFNLF